MLESTAAAGPSTLSLEVVDQGMLGGLAGDHKVGLGAVSLRGVCIREWAALKQLQAAGAAGAAGKGKEGPGTGPAAAVAAAAGGKDIGASAAAAAAVAAAGKPAAAAGAGGAVVADESREVVLPRVAILHKEKVSGRPSPPHSSASPSTLHRLSIVRVPPLIVPI